MPRGRCTEVKRTRLIRENGPECHYCDRVTDPEFDSLFPVVEHFIPRHLEKRLGMRCEVLACRWCDKAKGMLLGWEFMEIIEEGLRTHKHFVHAQQWIKRKCKQLNRGRHAVYEGRERIGNVSRNASASPT